MSEIKLDNISFTYTDRPLLANVNMQIASGEFIVILGPNGSGKSTLLRLMTGLIQPLQGTVTIEGIPVNDFRKTGKLGYVPQNYAKNAAFPATVEEIVSLGLVAQKTRLSKMAARHIVGHMLTLVGAAELAKRNFGELSGGQQQRIMVARALAGNPGVLFLDEPTSGIDPEASAKIYELLNYLNTSLGVTVVMVSHDIEMATKWASKVACVNYGLCYFGASQEFRAHHGRYPHSWYYSGM